MSKQQLILFPYLYALGHQCSFLVCSNKFASTSSLPPDYSPTLTLCCYLSVFSEQRGPHGSEEDGLLWHWCGGGRPSEGPNEQFPVLDNQPTGDCCAGDEGKACLSTTNACSSLFFRLTSKKGKKQTQQKTFCLVKKSDLLFCWLYSLKIHETIEYINQLKTERDFMLSFSNNPQDFIQDWLKSQSRDLKVNICSPALSYCNHFTTGVFIGCQSTTIYMLSVS